MTATTPQSSEPPDATDSPSAVPDPTLAPNPVKLRPVLLSALALLVGLAVLGAIFDLGDGVLLLTAPLEPRSPAPTADAQREDISALASHYRYSEPLDVSGPTTLEVTLERGAADGFLGVACSLVEQQTGDIREVGVGSAYRTTPTGFEGELATVAWIDQVPTGRYVLRYDAIWQPQVASTPAPAAELRLAAGKRSKKTLFWAAGLLVVPPLFSVGRWLRHEASRRRTKPSSGAMV